MFENLIDIYKNAHPWPYLIIDNFIRDTSLLDEAIKNIPSYEGDYSLRSNSLNDFNSRGTILDIRKLDKSINKIYDFLYSKEISLFLEKLCGYKIIDDLNECLCENGNLRGAGIHQIQDGGFFKAHRDPQIHHEKFWLRPLVGILYLNKNWIPENGGYLELYDDKCEKVISRIEPVYNRFVIMNNLPEFCKSKGEYVAPYHGVSQVKNYLRQSFCCFYYTKDKLGKSYDFYFKESSEVFIIAKKIRESNFDKKTKEFGFEIAKDIFEKKYKNFNSIEFKKICLELKND